MPDQHGNKTFHDLAADALEAQGKPVPAALRGEPEPAKAPAKKAATAKKATADDSGE